MNTPSYFELFGIPVSLRVDAPQLRTRFLDLSRKYHPDFFTSADEATRMNALEKSALLNRAWKTFQDPDALIRYVLISKGLMQDEEKYELPPDFLMEVLDLNEQLMDADPGATDLLPRLNEIESVIYEPVRQIIEGYDPARHTEQDLLQVKEYYYKKRYLDRMRRELAGSR